jgi:hypothetical protein
LRFQAPISNGHSTGRSGKRVASRSIEASVAAARASVVTPCARAVGSTLRKAPSMMMRPVASGSMRPATSVPSGVPTPACANSCGSRVPVDTSAPTALNAPVHTRSSSPTQSSWGSVLMLRSS